MRRYNCPNCGAGITGERCEFCGTVIYDFAAIQLGKPSYVKIIHNGVICMFRMIVDNMTVHHEAQTVDVPAASGCVRLAFVDSYCMNVSLDAHCVPMDTGALMTVIKKEE